MYMYISEKILTCTLRNRMHPTKIKLYNFVRIFIPWCFLLLFLEVSSYLISIHVSAPFLLCC
jgi:hypothetical protein